jgi:long-chain acyl-CoA synthetase
MNTERTTPLDLAAMGLIPASSPPRHPGGPRTTNDVLDGLIDAFANRDVLVGRHGRLTAAGLIDAVNRCAHGLRGLGVQPTDRVAVSLPNDVAIVVTLFAVLKSQAIWLGINRPLAPPEKAYMLRDAEVNVLITTADTAASLSRLPSGSHHLRHIVIVDPGGEADDWTDLLASSSADPLDLPADPLAPAAIAYTSGTTGFPKGAVHTQHNLLLPGMVHGRRPERAPGGTIGVALPLTILNLMVLGPLLAYQNQASLVAMDRIDAIGMAQWIEQEKVTTFSAVPAMVHDLLTNPEVSDAMLSSIESIGVGGADMPDAFRRLYENRFGRRVGTGYGLTEAPTAVTVEDVEQPPVPDSCGRAMAHVSIHIVGPNGQAMPVGEAGEVCVGPSTQGEFADSYRPMLGYWKRPDASAAALRNGLLHTGDVGVLDADGNLFIKDRKNDLIIRGGANVYPAEVERVLYEDPGVAACAVVGQPDDRLGERVIAFVEFRADATSDTAALAQLCQSELARYKVPDRIIAVNGFDRTPMGKIRKEPLRALLAAETSSGTT